MTERWTEARSAAMHQAGHAVTAFKLGRPFEYVTAAPGDGTFGCVRFSYPDGFSPDTAVTEPMWAFIEDYLMICLAGFNAEDSWSQGVSDRPNDVQSRLNLRADGDRHAAVNMGGYVSPEELESYIERLDQRAVAFVGPGGTYSSLVRQLADEFGSVQRLSGLDAELFLTQAEAEVGDS